MDLASNEPNERPWQEQDPGGPLAYVQAPAWGVDRKHDASAALRETRRACVVRNMLQGLEEDASSRVPVWTGEEISKNHRQNAELQSGGLA